MRHCNYYQRITDGTFWAILFKDGQPVTAAGPLAPPQITQAPATLAAMPVVDVTGWDVSAFAQSDELPWELVIEPGQDTARGNFSTVSGGVWRRQSPVERSNAPTFA